MQADDFGDQTELEINVGKPYPSIFDFTPYVELVHKKWGRTRRPYLIMNEIFSRPELRMRAFGYMTSDWETPPKGYEFDIVVALPDNGKQIATMVAQCSVSGCTLIEKGNNIEAPNYIDVEYNHSEEGRRRLQMGRGHLYEKKRPLLVDAVLGAGDKALAGAELVKKAGARKVIGVACFMELRDWEGEEYRGRERLREAGIKVRSLMIYENGKKRPTTNEENAE